MSKNACFETAAFKTFDRYDSMLLKQIHTKSYVLLLLVIRKQMHFFLLVCVGFFLRQVLYAAQAGLRLLGL
jgi:hypothetical protein